MTVLTAQIIALIIGGIQVLSLFGVMVAFIVKLFSGGS